MHDLKNKTAIVTGAARGIGLEITKTLAEYGVSVVATDVDEEKLTKSVQDINAGHPSSSVVSRHLDVTCTESWQKLIGFVDQEIGELNILVNNAGIMKSQPFMSMSMEDFRNAYTINVEGAVIGIRTAFETMNRSAEERNGYGSIVNISSIYGVVGGNLNAAYCASKGALTLLTKALAVEFGHGGAKLRVNSVHPGGVDTELGRGGMSAFVETGAAPNVEAVESMIEMSTPLGRMGRTDDIAGVVAFLGSDLSKFITGAEFVVDGGFTAA